ncbi:hypothetical protein DMENIID0001_141910 [Sergentomyia squamirostris]
MSIGREKYTSFGYRFPTNLVSIAVGEVCYSTKIDRTTFGRTGIRFPPKEEPLDFYQLASFAELQDKELFPESLLETRYKEILEERIGNHSLPPLEARNILTSDMLEIPQFYQMNNMTWNYEIAFKTDRLDKWTRDEKYSVAKYFWILIKYKDTAAGYIYRNVPEKYEAGAEHKFKLCATKCTFANDGEIASCCTYEELRKIIPEVPEVPGIKGLLLPVH